MIEDKLREILLSRTMGQYATDENGNFVPVNWEGSPMLTQYVDEIIQAFKDEGYSKLWYPTEGQMNGKKLMSGQEFYDRTVRFYNAKAEEEGFKSVESDSLVLEAARKAAGL